MGEPGSKGDKHGSVSNPSSGTTTAVSPSRQRTARQQQEEQLRYALGSRPTSRSPSRHVSFGPSPFGRRSSTQERIDDILEIARERAEVAAATAGAGGGHGTAAPAGMPSSASPSSSEPQQQPLLRRGDSTAVGSIGSNASSFTSATEHADATGSGPATVATALGTGGPYGSAAPPSAQPLKVSGSSRNKGRKRDRSRQQEQHEGRGTEDEDDDDEGDDDRHSRRTGVGLWWGWRLERKEGPRRRRPWRKADDDSGWSAFIAKFQSIELENKGSVARDHLALERTFLAWLRTSLAFASIGIAVTQLFRLNTAIAHAPREDGSPAGDPSSVETLRHLGKPLGATFLTISILILFLGYHRYFESQQWVIKGKFPASRGTVMVVSLVAFIVMLASLVVVVVIQPSPRET